MEPAWAKLNLSLDVLGARAEIVVVRGFVRALEMQGHEVVPFEHVGSCRAWTCTTT